MKSNGKPRDGERYLEPEAKLPPPLSTEQLVDCEKADLRFSRFSRFRLVGLFDLVDLVDFV